MPCIAPHWPIPDGGRRRRTPHLRRHVIARIVLSVMPTAMDSQQHDNDRLPPAEGNAIPRRQHRSAVRTGSIPPPTSPRQHTIRLAVATAIGLLLMLVLLLLAVKYAQRDWRQKQHLARASGISHGSDRLADAETRAAIPGWPYEWSPNATRRMLRHLTSDPRIDNWWLIQGRGHPDHEQAHLVVGLLRMAMATGGESADMKNDFGAAYLQQRRLRAAMTQFQAALQIEPGYAPALFNLALCSITQRDPAKGSRYLAHYLARRPTDTAAYRLQSSLLTQLGRPQEALDMLERFLRNQPPTQPLFLEASLLAARRGHHGTALRYLETAMAGNPIQTVVRAYQSSSFRAIRLSGTGDALAARMASQARVAFGTPLPVEELAPLRNHPDAIVR